MGKCRNKAWKRKAGRNMQGAPWYYETNTVLAHHDLRNKTVMSQHKNYKPSHLTDMGIKDLRLQLCCNNSDIYVLYTLYTCTFACSSRVFICHTRHI